VRFCLLFPEYTPLQSRVTYPTYTKPAFGNTPRFLTRTNSKKLLLVMNKAYEFKRFLWEIMATPVLFF